jgi:hypothetical protein
MAIFNDDLELTKGDGIKVDVRSGSVDAEAIDARLFPHSAFEFDDPSITDSGSEIRLKTGWTLKVGTGAITSTEIASGAVGNDELATDAVSRVKIQNGEIIATKLATDSVEELKIKDGAVTLLKIDDDAVDEASIVDGTITSQSLSTDKADDYFIDIGTDPGEVNLIAYYSLDEVEGTYVTDSSGSGYHGTLVTGSGGWESGKVGNEYHFDSVSEHIALPTSIGTLSSFSISAWIKVDTLTT